MLVRQALVGHCSPSLCEAVALGCSDRRSPKMDQYTLAGAAYGLAALGYDGPLRDEAFAALRSRTLELAPKLRPQSLASLSSAFAAAGGADDGRVFQALGAQAAGIVGEFAPSQLADVLEAFRAAGQPRGGVLAAAAVAVKEMRGGEGGGDTQGLERLLRAAEAEEGGAGKALGDEIRSALLEWSSREGEKEEASEGP